MPSITERIAHAARLGVFGLAFSVSKDVQVEYWKGVVTASLSGIQMLSFPLNSGDRFPWQSFGPVSSFSRSLDFITTARIDEAHSPVVFRAFLAISASWTALFLLLSLLVGCSFAQNLPQNGFLLRTLRRIAQLSTTYLFLPFTGVLFRALACPASYDGWMDTGWACGGSEHAILAVLIGLLLAAFTTLSLFSAATFLDRSPSSDSWVARAHGRIVVLLLILKVLLGFLYNVVGEQVQGTNFLLFVLAVVGVLWASLHFYFMPFIHPFMNAIEVGFALVFTWCTAALAIRTWDPDRDVTYFVYIGAVAAFALGFCATLLREARIADLPLSKLQTATEHEVWARKRLRRWRAVIASDSPLGTSAAARLGHIRVTDYNTSLSPAGQRMSARRGGGQARGTGLQEGGEGEAGGSDSARAFAGGLGGSVVHGRGSFGAGLSSTPTSSSFSSSSASGRAAGHESIAVRGSDATGGGGWRGAMAAAAQDLQRRYPALRPRDETVTPMELLEDAERAYRQLMERFPQSELALTHASVFFRDHSSFHFPEALALSHAKKLKPAIDLEYYIYERTRQLRETDKSEMSPIDRILFDQQLREVKQMRIDALRQLVVLWESLSSRQPELANVDSAGVALHKLMGRIEGLYQELLRVNADSTAVLRSYASYLMEIGGEPARAMELANRAERIEEVHSKQHQRNLRHVVFGAQAANNDAVDERSAVVTISADPSNVGEIIAVSVTACRLFGYTAAQLVGQNVSFLTPPPIRERHNDFLRRLLSTGRSQMMHLSRLMFGLRRSGDIFPLWLQFSEAPPDEDSCAPRLSAIMQPVNTDENHIMFSSAASGHHIFGASQRSLFLLGIESEAYVEDQISMFKWFPSLQTSFRPERVVITWQHENLVRTQPTLANLMVAAHREHHVGGGGGSGGGAGAGRGGSSRVPGSWDATDAGERSKTGKSAPFASSNAFPDGLSASTLARSGGLPPPTMGEVNGAGGPWWAVASLAGAVPVGGAVPSASSAASSKSSASGLGEDGPGSAATQSDVLPLFEAPGSTLVPVHNAADGGVKYIVGSVQTVVIPGVDLIHILRWHSLPEPHTVHRIGRDGRLVDVNAAARLRTAKLSTLNDLDSDLEEVSETGSHDSSEDGAGGALDSSRVAGVGDDDDEEEDNDDEDDEGAERRSLLHSVKKTRRQTGRGYETTGPRGRKGANRHQGADAASERARRTSSHRTIVHAPKRPGTEVIGRPTLDPIPTTGRPPRPQLRVETPGKHGSSTDPLVAEEGGRGSASREEDSATAEEDLERILHAIHAKEVASASEESSGALGGAAATDAARIAAKVDSPVVQSVRGKRLMDSPTFDEAGDRAAGTSSSARSRSESPHHPSLRGKQVDPSKLSATAALDGPPTRTRSGRRSSLPVAASNHPLAHTTSGSRRSAKVAPGPNENEAVVGRADFQGTLSSTPGLADSSDVIHRTPSGARSPLRSAVSSRPRAQGTHHTLVAGSGRTPTGAGVGTPGGSSGPLGSSAGGHASAYSVYPEGGEGGLNEGGGDGGRAGAPSIASSGSRVGAQLKRALLASEQRVEPEIRQARLGLAGLYVILIGMVVGEQLWTTSQGVTVVNSSDALSWTGVRLMAFQSSELWLTAVEGVAQGFERPALANDTLHDFVGFVDEMHSYNEALYRLGAKGGQEGNDFDRYSAFEVTEVGRVGDTPHVFRMPVVEMIEYVRTKLERAAYSIAKGDAPDPIILHNFENNRATVLEALRDSFTVHHDEYEGIFPANENVLVIAGMTFFALVTLLTIFVFARVALSLQSRTVDLLNTFLVIPLGISKDSQRRWLLALHRAMNDDEDDEDDEALEREAEVDVDGGAAGGGHRSNDDEDRRSPGGRRGNRVAASARDRFFRDSSFRTTKNMLRLVMPTIGILTWILFLVLYQVDVNLRARIVNEHMLSNSEIGSYTLEYLRVLREIQLRKGNISTLIDHALEIDHELVFLANLNAFGGKSDDANSFDVPPIDAGTFAHAVYLDDLCPVSPDTVTCDALEAGVLDDGYYSGLMAFISVGREFISGALEDRDTSDVSQNVSDAAQNAHLQRLVAMEYPHMRVANAKVTEDLLRTQQTTFLDGVFASTVVSIAFACAFVVLSSLYYSSVLAELAIPVRAARHMLLLIPEEAIENLPYLRHRLRTIVNEIQLGLNLRDASSIIRDADDAANRAAEKDGDHNKADRRAADRDDET